MIEQIFQDVAKQTPALVVLAIVVIRMFQLQREIARAQCDATKTQASALSETTSTIANLCTEIAELRGLMYGYIRKKQDATP